MKQLRGEISLCFFQRRHSDKTKHLGAEKCLQTIASTTEAQLRENGRLLENKTCVELGTVSAQTPCGFVAVVISACGDIERVFFFCFLIQPLS